MRKHLAGVKVLKSVRLSLILLMLLTGLQIFFRPTITYAETSDSQYFPQTQHTVSGLFLDYWKANGGLAIFGYPISDAQMETNPETNQSYLTQWFERSRFELHPATANQPAHIELGLLGNELTREAQAVDPNFQRKVATPPPYWPGGDNSYEYIPETGHNISGEFLDYWLSHGGVAVFGLPISEQYSEVQLGGSPNFGGNGSPAPVQVQWFERARLELTEVEEPAPTPVKPGEPPVYVPPQPLVQLSLLGDELKNLNPPDSRYMWETGGDGSNFINYGIALDSHNNIYVSDALGLYLTKYDQAGNQLAQWQIHSFFESPPQGHATPIAIDSHDNIFIVDSSDDYVKKFDSNGKLLLQWGGGGSQDGHFLNPLGIAVDKNGYVYIADTGNNRIQKFDSDGHYLMQWGSYGGNPGQFIAPEGVTVDNQGHLYVADTLNNSIEKFDTNGNYITRWGSYSTEPGKFKAPRNLAADANGNLFVLEGESNTSDGNDRVQKFDPNGKLITLWGGKFITDTHYYFGGETRGLTVGSDGSVYVADTNDRVLKYNNNGQFVTSFDEEHPGDGHFVHPAAAALDLQGNLYVTDAGNYRVQKLDSQGRFILKWGSEGKGNGQFELPTGIAVDKAGDVYVADNNNSRIQKFDSQGHFLLGWGSVGNGDGQFVASPVITTNLRAIRDTVPTEIGGVAVDSQNNVYVADIGHSRIQKFDSQGHFLAKWDIPPYNNSTTVGSPIGDFDVGIGPTSIAIDNNDNVYVAGMEGGPIYKYDTNGHQLTSWFMNGAKPDPSKPNNIYYFPMPAGVAVDSTGKVYVSDTFDNSLQVFDSNGHLLQQLGALSAGAGLPHGAFQGMVVNNQVNALYFLYYNTSRVVKYRWP